MNDASEMIPLLKVKTYIYQKTQPDSEYIHVLVEFDVKRATDKKRIF